MMGMYFNPSFSKETNGDPGPSRKYSGCCTSLFFLEVIFFLSIAFHSLSSALGISMLHHQENSSPSAVIQMNRDQAIELLVVGVTGALVNILAVFGLWHKQRHFLLPLVLFLLIDIILDALYVFSFCVSDQLQESLPEEYHPLWALAPPGPGQQGTRVSLITLLACKMIFSLILLRLVVFVYKRDLTMRTGRSPLRKKHVPAVEVGVDVMKTQREKDKGLKSEEKLGQFSNIFDSRITIMTSEEKPPKIGQYNQF